MLTYGPFFFTLLPFLRLLKMKYVHDTLFDMNCPFCEDPRIRTQKIFENELVFAFPTNIPITPGHTLVCPKRHASALSELTTEELQALMTLGTKITVALKKAFGAEGFNFAWNEGEAAGQAISHLHLHVVPRKAGDAGIYEYEPRKFLYRPGEREDSPEEELQAITKMIKNFL